MYIFYGLRAILDLDKTLSNQGLKCCIFPISQNSNVKVDLDTHLKYWHGHLFLWDLELFWPSFKDGQTKVEKMHFCRLFHNWNLKVNFGTHFNKQTRTPTFVVFWAIFTAFKCNLCQSAHRSFTFDQFFGIKVAS